MPLNDPFEGRKPFRPDWERRPDTFDPKDPEQKEQMYAEGSEERQKAYQRAEAVTTEESLTPHHNHCQHHDPCCYCNGAKHCVQARRSPYDEMARFYEGRENGVARKAFRRSPDGKGLRVVEL